ncbi:hypothetical protein ILYODFUR_036279 [Ilyodon furcidens]|uniref:Uncharacterized protein n=1 Tax=Ilyodon furcidens TaxID=33524 RepID=A0ABV0U3K6_9TELE
MIYLSANHVNPFKQRRYCGGKFRQLKPQHGFWQRQGSGSVAPSRSSSLGPCAIIGPGAFHGPKCTKSEYSSQGRRYELNLWQWQPELAAGTVTGTATACRSCHRNCQSLPELPQPARAAKACWRVPGDSARMPEGARQAIKACHGGCRSFC